MKKYIIYILGILLTFGISACEDFLREESESQFTMETLFETPEGINKMAEALYAYERSLSRRGDANGLLASHIWGERTTDLVVFTTGGDANLSRYTSPGPSSNINGALYNPFWTHRYYMIGRANEIIHYGSEFGEDAEVAVAEGYFWRAYSYYGLWSRFSRLFLTTEPITKDNLDGIEFVPADSAKVFQLMYEDIDKAIANLPKKDAQDGKLTEDAARHMKALIAAWAKDWPEVLAQVDTIEMNGVHTMAADPHSVFDRKDFYNFSESLFSLNFSMDRGGGQGHRLGTQYINIMSEIDYTHKIINGVVVKYHEDNLGRSWALAHPNSYLMSLYPADDKRLSAYYKTHYTYQNPNMLITIPIATTVTDSKTGRPYTTSYNTTGAPIKISIGDTIHGRDIYAATNKKLDRRNIIPSCIKMYDKWDKPIDADGPMSYKDVMIFRLAESYLLAAEAAVKFDNQIKAKYYYNKTWKRAGHPEITSNITFEMIMDEQARELAFEGRRWDFLKRNGLWYSQMIKYAGDFTKYPGSSIDYNSATYGVTDGRDAAFGPNPDYYIDFNGSDNDILVRFNVKPIHVNWPIPQTQIDAMGAENFPQTDGY